MEQATLITELLELFSPQRLIQMLLVIIATASLVFVLKHLMQSLERRFYRYRFYFLRLFPFIRLLIWLLALSAVVIGILRPTQNMLLALSASFGIAFGLAAQDILKNWLAGLVMLFSRPYQIGDIVQVAGHYGEIIDIDMVVTRMRTFDDNVVTIPNGEVMKQAVANANHGELTEMVVVHFDLPATVDVAAVREIAWEAAICSPYTYLKKPVTIVVEDRFEHTFLTHFQIKVYVVDVRLERLLASDIIERLKRELVQRDLLSEQLVIGILHAMA